MDDEMEELKQTFFTECSELLTDMEERLMKLEPGSTDTEQLNAIFRCAHSIKGGSGAFGYETIMNFTHVLEALLDAMREKKVLPKRESIDALLKSVDIVNKMLETAKAGGMPTAETGAEMLVSLRAFAEEGGAIVRAPMSHAELDAMVAKATEEKVGQPSEEATKPKGDDAPAAANAKGTTSIRVDLEKVDRLVNMIGELVITEAMLRAQARHLEQFTGLMRGIDELSHHTRELQEAVMAVRMQPVKSVFSRMPRIVRDTAAQLGKDIQLVMSGENTEVDKTVIEQLGDPLTHMIRNSCDHGIETPDQRAWNDKPVQGTIHLSAYHRSGRIIIDIQDDGKGIDRARVLAKAKEKNLVTPEAQLTDEEIDHLIFLPGFSTAEKVTSVSGRGVGMDVVRRNIESLGGMVRITNHPGKGSLFTVSLPLTLAILDGMIVRVGSENYIVPITSIIETLRPKQEDVHAVQGRSEVINVRGEFIPLIYLHHVFNIQDAEHDASRALIVLVESGTQKMGLVVDELVGQQQVVIKSLEANADPVKGVSGATILGDGKVSLILEIGDLKAITSPPPYLAKAA